MTSTTTTGNFGNSKYTGNKIKKKIVITSRPRGKTKITYTTRSGGSYSSKKDALEAIKQEVMRESVVPKTGTKRILQNGVIYDVKSDGTFTRVRFTPEEYARRERIRSGTARASDIFRGVDRSTSEGQNIVLQRLQPALRKQQVLEQERIRREQQARQLIPKPSADTFLKASELSKIKSILQKPRTNITMSDINYLNKRADAINKRGERLSSNQFQILNLIKQKLSEEKVKTDKFLDKFPKKLANLGKIGTKASKQFDEKLAEYAIGMGSIGNYVAQVADKIIFAGEVGIKSAKQKEFKQFIKRGIDESGRVSPEVQRALRDAFKDPSTYAFALLGARISPKSPIPEFAKVVEMNVPKSKSPTAIVLKNTVVKSKGRTYYVDKNANVYSVRTIKGETFLRKTGQTKPSKPAYEQLGFESQKQFSKWEKLNEKSKVATGKKLSNVNKQIAKIENSILSSKNVAQLTKIKNLQKNLEKARNARRRAINYRITLKGLKEVKAKAKAPKTRISQRAKRRSELAKIKQEKSKITQDRIRKAGFKNQKEFIKANKLGLKTKKDYNKFLDLVEKATKGNKSADTLLLKRFKKISIKKAKARAKAYITRQKTLDIKKKIQVARKGRIGKKASKKSVKQPKLKVIQNEYVDNILQSSKSDGYYRYDKDFPVIGIHSKFKKGTKQYNRILKHELTHHKTRKIFNEGKLAKKIGKIDRKITYKLRPSEIIARSGEILPARFFKIKGKSIKTSKYTRLIEPKKIVKTIIERVKITGKKGQQKFSIDETLITLKRLKAKETFKTRSKLRLRVLQKGKFSFRLIPKAILLSALSAKTINKFKQIQLVPTDVTLTYQEALDDAIKSIIRDIIVQLPKEKIKNSTKIGLREISEVKNQQKQELRTKRIIRRKPKNQVKIIKLPIEPPKLLPNLNFNSKKLENRILTFEGKFRERRNPNKKVGKSNPIITKTIRLRDTKNRALQRVARRVDNTLSASLTLRVVGVGKAKKDIKPPRILGKFRTKKRLTSPALQLVERNKFRFDKRGEKLESKRLKRA